MPTKNIYVSKDDLQLFDDAARYAESASAAVVQALHDYIRAQQRRGEGFEEIELTLHEQGIRRKVLFHGRELMRVERPVDAGLRVDTIYRTAKGQIAVATKVRKPLPEWHAGDEGSWADPRTWSRDFWISGDRTLAVYPDIESLEAQDAHLAECCRSSLSAQSPEFLDI